MKSLTKKIEALQFLKGNSSVYAKTIIGVLLSTVLLFTGCNQKSNPEDLLLFGLAESSTVPETAEQKPEEETGGPTDGETESVEVSETVNADVPEDYETHPEPEGNFDGALFEAGDDNTEGFVASVPTELSASDLMDRILQTVNDSYGSGSVSLISRREVDGAPIDTEIANLQISIPAESATTATTFRNALVGLIGTVDGSGEVSNLPESGSTEYLAAEFRVVLQASQEVPDAIVLVGATPVDNYANAEESLVTMIDGTNVGPSDWTREAKNDSFTTVGPPKADFLFTVDNSGSMDMEQQLVINQAINFFDRLSSLGVDFRIAVNTTDQQDIYGPGDYHNRDTCEDGFDSTGYTRTGFSSDRNEFTRNICVGTGGSGAESAVYHAEQSLLGSGSVVNSAYPRADASFSVIMVSDEGDIYTAYDDGDKSNSPSFDVLDNVFTQNDYTVYGIVALDSTGQPGECSSDKGSATNTSFNGSDADKEMVSVKGISSATSGGVSSICGSNYGDFLLEIADQAAAQASPYDLTQTPISNTLVVKVNGVKLARTNTPASGATGYKYNSSSNSIAFTGETPAPGDSLEVSYSYYVKN